MMPLRAANTTAFPWTLVRELSVDDETGRFRVLRASFALVKTPLTAVAPGSADSYLNTTTSGRAVATSVSLAGG